MELRHQPGSGLREFRPGHPNAWKTCSRKVPAVTTPTLSNNATVAQDFCLQWSDKALELCKADWNRFCLLTGESVERRPPPETANIEKAYQELYQSLLFAAIQSIPRGRCRNYVPCWDKECVTLYRSFLRPQWGVTLRAASFLLSRLDQKRQEWFGSCQFHRLLTFQP